MGLGTASVPTVKMRSGDFSELLNPSFTNGQFQTTFPVCLPNAGVLNSNIPLNSRGTDLRSADLPALRGQYHPQGSSESRRNQLPQRLPRCLPAPTRRSKTTPFSSSLRSSTTASTRVPTGQHPQRISSSSASRMTTPSTEVRQSFLPSRTMQEPPTCMPEATISAIPGPSIRPS